MVAAAGLVQQRRGTCKAAACCCSDCWLYKTVYTCMCTYMHVPAVYIYGVRLLSSVASHAGDVHEASRSVV
jgi:hypothetical protein